MAVSRSFDHCTTWFKNLRIRPLGGDSTPLPQLKYMISQAIIFLLSGNPMLTCWRKNCASVLSTRRRMLPTPNSPEGDKKLFTGGQIPLRGGRAVKCSSCCLLRCAWIPACAGMTRGFLSTSGVIPAQAGIQACDQQELSQSTSQPCSGEGLGLDCGG